MDIEDVHLTNSSVASRVGFINLVLTDTRAHHGFLKGKIHTPSSLPSSISLRELWGEEERAPCQLIWISLRS
jgi:hypothetical protein